MVFSGAAVLSTSIASSFRLSTRRGAALAAVVDSVLPVVELRGAAVVSAEVVEEVVVESFNSVVDAVVVSVVESEVDCVVTFVGGAAVLNSSGDSVGRILLEINT